MLLHRITQRVIIRPDAGPDVEDVRRLAAQRSVPVEERSDLLYACVGFMQAPLTDWQIPPRPLRPRRAPYERRSRTMTTQLYLIRHGESVANVEPIIGGMRGDAGLTDRGRNTHVCCSSGYAARLHADQLYASTLPRAWQTADYVARALRLPVQPVKELHGFDPGRRRDDGGPVAGPIRRRRATPDPQDRFPRFLPVARAGRLSSPAPVPPSPPWSIATPARTIVAVCHAGIVEASFDLAVGLGSTGNRVSFAPLDTGITHWRHHREPGGRREWTIVTFIDAGHLAAATESPRAAVPTPAGEI